jgi:hypothetical protein
MAQRTSATIKKSQKNLDVSKIYLGITLNATEFINYLYFIYF